MPIVPNTSKSEGTPPKKSTITFDLSRPVYSLSDLILPTHTLNELNRDISLREHQTAVFEQWGFKHTHKYDNKMIINLYGEPGTGKTMAAHAIAKRLNRPLVLINYGDIESKYVGETPKNIQNAFAFAKENDARIIVRGLRAVTDYENEMQIAQTNRQICEDIETLFLITSLEYAFLSSTIVKEIASFGKDVSNWVPKVVEDKLKEKFGTSLL